MPVSDLTGIFFGEASHLEVGAKATTRLSLTAGSRTSKWHPDSCVYLRSIWDSNVLLLATQARVLTPFALSVFLLEEFPTTLLRGCPAPQKPSAGKTCLASLSPETIA